MQERPIKLLRDQSRITIVRGVSPSQPGPPENAQWFATTHWSVVLAARDGEEHASSAALERLCRTYWPPVYAFLRRDGHNAEDAQDLTQEFLSRFVHREWLDHLQDRRGKFRSFLLTFLKHFLSEQRGRANTQKRGGGKMFVSIDACEEEERAISECIDGETADQIYDRRWVREVMVQAVRELREEYVAKGQEALFDAIKDLQPGEHGAQSYSELGAALGMSEPAIKNAVHRFRRHYSELLRTQIAQTLTDPSQVDEEIRYLLQVFST
jgi:RNA polymerase sigma-70 factor (ECF subfamily)